MNLDKYQCVTLIWLLNVTHWIFCSYAAKPDHVQAKISHFHWNISIKISPMTLTSLCHSYGWYLQLVFLINHSNHYYTIIQIPDMWTLPVRVREDWLATVDDVIRHSLSQHSSPPCLIFLHHHQKDRSLRVVIAEFGCGIANLFSLWNRRALVFFGRHSLTSSATLSHSLLRHLRFIPI